MTIESTGKKDIQKLQRAIVDGLEDVKGQDIVVFNTEELSPLFERVIIASGTSNRQTKALAASVRDAVKEAGFDKPRVEGEENGEWIIVDCGQAVAHVMQPVIRQYYRLEEIWGAKPVRVKHGAAKPVTEAKPATKKKAAKTPEAAPVSAKTVARKAAAKKAAANPVSKSTQARPATKVASKPAGKTVAGKAPAKRAATASPARKAPARPKAALPKVVVGKPVAKKAAAKSTTGRTTAAKPATRSAPRKTTRSATPKKA